MSRRHADNWSHPGHYLVDPYTWPWSPNGHGHEWPTATPFVQCQSALSFWDTAFSKFDHENQWSRSCVWSKVKVTSDLQNSKVKVMVNVKPIGHIWGLEFNRYVCYLFRGNRTMFGWDIANSIFGQGHDENRPRCNQVIYRSRPTIVPKKKEIQNFVQKWSREQESEAGGGGGGGGGGDDDDDDDGVRTGTKT